MPLFKVCIYIFFLWEKTRNKEVALDHNNKAPYCFLIFFFKGRKSGGGVEVREGNKGR